MRLFSNYLCFPVLLFGFPVSIQDSLLSMILLFLFVQQPKIDYIYFHLEISIFHFHKLKVFLDKPEGLLIVFDYSLPKPNSKHLFIQVFLMRYSA